MSRGPCTSRDSDVKRAVKAVEAAGKKVTLVEIDTVNGKIRLVVGEPGAQVSAANEWDEVLDAQDAQVR